MTVGTVAIGNRSSGTEVPGEVPARNVVVDPSPATHRSAKDSARGEVSRDAAWRHTRVATAAYYISQRRGFEPGFDIKDWGLAESQIDALDETDGD